MWDDFTEEERNQVWAEAVEIYKAGEVINGLPDDISKEAVVIQQAHSEDNDILGIIERYLEIKLPDKWEKLSIAERCQWINATDEFRNENGENLKRRERVAVIEVWCECFKKDKADITITQSRKIGESLRKLGWKRLEKSGRYGPYGVQRGFAIE